jgi:hypothetical protein
MNMWDKILTKGGNRAGQAVGAATGAVQLIGAKAAKKRAMEATPEQVDPQQSAFLAELQQKKNALNVGSEYSSSIDAINDKMSQSQDVLAGNSGGDTASTVAALLKAQQVGNQGEGQVLAQGQQMEGMYNGLYGDLLNKVVQRKLELGLLDRAQNMAEWARKKQSGSANFLAGAQSFLDWKGGDKKATNPMESASQVSSVGTGIGGSTTGNGGSPIGGSTPGKGTAPIGGSTPSTGGGMIGGQKSGGASGFLNKIGGSTGGAGGAAKGSSAMGSGMDFSKMLSAFGK